MYRLVRKGDGRTHTSSKVCYVSFYVKTGMFRKKHRLPKIGRSLLMSPFSIYFTWMTTQITEIIEEKEGYTHFKTLNSEYELFKEQT